MIATYDYCEAFTYTFDTTRPPEVPQVEEKFKKYVINHKYTYISDLPIKINDEVLCEGTQFPFIGIVTACDSYVNGNLKKVIKNITDWSFEKKLGLKNLLFVKKHLLSCQNKEDGLKLYQDMVRRITGYNIAANAKNEIIKIIKNEILKYFENKETR